MTDVTYGWPGRRREGTRWALAFALALAAHAGVGLAVLFKRSPAMGTSEPSTVLIELAPIVSSRVADAKRAEESPAAAASEPQGEKKSFEPPREEPMQFALEQPPEVPALEIKPPLDVNPPIEQLPREASVVAEPLRQQPEPKPKIEIKRETPVESKRKPIVEKKPQERKEKPLAKAPERVKDDRRQLAALPKDTGRDNAKGGAGSRAVAVAAVSASAMAAWQGRLSAHLERFKRYPPDAHGERGVALVRFSVNPQGHVLSRQVARSSGSAALDRESLALLARAQPLPAPPAEMRQPRIDVAVPIQFEAR